MNDSYIPHQHPSEKPKAFSIGPAPDDIGEVIKDARHKVTHDRLLTDGAKVLFTILLDLACSRSTYAHFGSVLISTTKLRERMYRSARAIYKWKKQLVARRHLWITKEQMPNFWDMDLYHVTALDSPGNPTMMPTKDGFWGNGKRRGPAPMDSQGARATASQTKLKEVLRGTKGHRSENGDTDGNSTLLAEKSPGTGTKGHAPAAQNAAGSGKLCGPRPQTVRRGPARKDTGEPHNVRATPAQNGTGQPHKQSHNKKPLVASVHQSLEYKGGGTASPPIFERWKEGLEGKFDRELFKLRSDLQALAKQADPSILADIDRRIGAINEKLYGGPVPARGKAKAVPLVKQSAPVSKASPEELARLRQQLHASVEAGR